jgi:hypothetical protein
MQGVATRIAIMTAALLLAAAGILATGVFLCIALYEGLRALLTPAMAALCAAGILLVLSLLVILVGSALAGAAARKAKKNREKQGSPAARIGGELGRLLGESAFKFVSDNPARVLIASVVTGFAVGAIPKLRKFLLDILKSR